MPGVREQKRLHVCLYMPRQSLYGVLVKRGKKFCKVCGKDMMLKGHCGCDRCICDRKDLDYNEHNITCPVILTDEVLANLGL
jgi:hypothetical protein